MKTFLLKIGKRALIMLCVIMIVFSFEKTFGPFFSDLSFFEIPSVMAGENDSEGSPDEDEGEDLGNIFSLLSQGAGNVISVVATLLVKLLSGILWFVLYWMGDLMDNTFILEGEMGEKLKSVWVIVRNFVNIFFALALVVIAFISVIGYGDDSGNYSIKKFIPKMALALIAVNFTFTACKLVLDLNNVLTTAVFSIPKSVTNYSDIGPSGLSGTEIFKRMRCLDKEPYSKALKRMDQLQKDYPNVINSLGGICFAIGPENVEGRKATLEELRQKKEIIPLTASQFTKKDFVWSMATQFQGIHDLNKVSQLAEKEFTTLTVNALFSIIFAVVYATAYIAMFIILIARMVVLWMTIMLSPLVAISIAIPDLLPEDLNIQKKFLDHAFVPLKMAIPLSFGYILISQMTLAINTDSAIFSDKSIDLSEGGEFARGASITRLMYGAASVAVIWAAVFTASKDVVGASFVEEHIKGFVESVGKTASKWPTYIPIIPFSGGKVSLSGLQSSFTLLQDQLAQQQRERDKADYDKIFGKVFPRGQIADAVQTFKRMINEKKYDASRAQQGWKDLSGDPERFKDIAVKFANTAWKAPDKHEIETHLKAYGVTDFEHFKRIVKDSAELTKLRERIGASTTTSSSAAPAVNYEAANSLFAGNEFKFQVDVTSLLPTDREHLGLEKSATGPKDLDLTVLGAEGFVKLLHNLSLGGKQKLMEGANTAGKMLPAGKLREDAFKNIAKIDSVLRSDLEKAITPGTGLDPAIKQKNRALYDLLIELYPDKKEDITGRFKDAHYEFYPALP